MRLILDFNFYNLVYFFAFYSFLGWCIEVIYYYKNEHRFVNRGFLKGPFCPIYGYSIVTIVIFLDKYKSNVFVLFLLGFLFTSLFEYATGFILEKAFKAKWWDYSDDPFNIQGRVCLPYSILWATGEVIIVDVIHPIVNAIVNKIPAFSGMILFYMIIIYFLLDFSLTLTSLSQFNFFPSHFELAFNKSTLASTRLRAMYTLKSFEEAIERFKFNSKNKRLTVRFYPRGLTQIINTLKKKLKKD